MQTLTKGGMENLFRRVRTLSLLCCIVCISSAEERHSLSKVVGSSVKLYCNNESLNTLKQVTWKRNGEPLLSFEPQSPIHQFPEALSLNISMSESENELYALIIESVRMEHEGNYTCDIISPSGVWKKEWELIITENQQAGKLDMRIMIPVFCTCSLAFMMILILIIVQRVCKKPPENTIQSSIAEEQTEDIYENCLEMNVRPRPIYNKPLQYSTMAH
ncbi:cell surface glycoprotein CD200 receptor 2-like isoform X2 [Sphaeramia orbicularis]|uniref:cell surface glycoprotein CD200 receptor 2-like isoform X2 n=1 Tax=Sphaeramia orbicularis TaxID=375764 RepID=UPI00117EB26D|nr:cell surface glycoprotein CD200 receptor 2-like isoform X2 [Sphaeramia orbicularis]